MNKIRSPFFRGPHTRRRQVSIGSYKQIAPRVATEIQTQVVGEDKGKIILISETSWRASWRKKSIPGGGNNRVHKNWSYRQV